MRRVLFVCWRLSPELPRFTGRRGELFLFVGGYNLWSRRVDQWQIGGALDVSLQLESPGLDRLRVPFAEACQDVRVW